MKKVNVLYDRGSEQNYCEIFEVEDDFVCNPHTLSKMIYEETGFQISMFDVKVWSVWETNKTEKCKKLVAVEEMCLN